VSVRAALIAGVAGAALATALGVAAARKPRLARVESFGFAIGEGALAGNYLKRLGPYDLVVVDGVEARRSQVSALRSGGKVVLAYLSVGTIERYRPGTGPPAATGWTCGATGASGTPTPRAWALGG